jgi:hypothetical protein
MLSVTNRLAEAEPLMRRHWEIFLKFTRDTGHPHPHLETAIHNYLGLIKAMGCTEDEASQKLHELAPEFSPKKGTASDV